MHSVYWVFKCPNVCRFFMNQNLKSYIPGQAHEQVCRLLEEDHINILIKKERKTRHGDYRKMRGGVHQITVNANLNPYKFLITLIHEIAHYQTYKTYGFSVKPHGKEWKNTFQHLILPFLHPTIFPNSLLPLLAKHFKNPKASSDTDVALSYALKAFDAPNEKTYIFEIEDGAVFKASNGKFFKRIKKRRTRFECQALETGRLYTFSPHAEVKLVINENE